MASYSTTFPTDEDPLSESGAWVSSPGSWDAMRVVSGLAQAAAINGNGGMAQLVSAIGANQYARGTVGSGLSVGGEVSVMLRMPSSTDGAGYYFNLTSIGNYEIYSVTDGGTLTFGTAIKTGVVGTPSAGQTYEARVQGSCLSLVYQGVLIGTITNSARTAGQPAIGAFSNTATSAQVWDGWDGGDYDGWPGAGYPRIVDVAVTKLSTNTTTPSFNIPACASGDLLILVIAKDGTGALTWPGSPAFTVITNAAGTGGATASNYGDARYRIVDGTEGWGSGGTLAFTGNPNETYYGLCYRITGHDAAAAVECASAQSTAGTQTAPDPPSLTPSWGAANGLWIACAMADGIPAVTAWPTSYFDWPVGEATAAVASTDCTMMAAARYVNPGGSGAENPGTFTIATQQWRALTLAVKPATAITAPVMAQQFGAVGMP